MQTPIFDAALRQLAVASISGYQKHISPIKGFSCAHRVLYAGESCSQYIKGAIAKFGLFGAIKASRRRFAACKHANQILKARFTSESGSEDSNFEGNDEPKSDRPKSQGETPGRSSLCENYCTKWLDCIEWLDCGGADCSGLDCGGADCSGLDCGGADCSGLDCGGADCSGLDCGGADCGSCF
ncbi:membrane protein insertion efficiency factor YidD [Lyngbya sp. CCAP 1446/10]|uniref:membrane protein insertion efficiency factor YidD n=3 Tax=Microcoleaceae TaxID=1892252 RepID=UPI002237DD5C|nr:membrane protein insertion efficiency factor YidD [Lyngbya sp. CCAP 1446/10]MCW6049005.1 membrane protein insertion efficiency factor YidD [Lyngbya sp. CCAP 1446/10]